MAPRIVRCTGLRLLFLALGLFCLSLGILGLFVPLLPTTVFLLIALWAFGKSSGRFHRWLYEHPTLGATIRAWHQHRVIPRRAKLTAYATMLASLLLTIGFITGPSLAAGGGALAVAAVAVWMARQPGAAPPEQAAQ